MKKILAMLLAVIMVMSMAACGGNEPAETTGSVETTAPVTTAGSNLVDKYTVKYGSVNAGAIELNPNTAEGGGEVSYAIYKGIEGKDYTDEAVYTSNDYLAGTTNMKWDPLNWETSDDSYVLGYISDSLVTFALNETADGWCVEFSMATAYEDVTSQYVGQYGVKEGDYGKAWKFTLNPAACWEDGTPINADTFIYSAQEQLSPLMNNRRADSLYAGEYAVYGAKSYYYQGKTIKQENNTGAAYTVADLVKGDDGAYVTAEGKPVYIAVGAPLSDWLGGNSLAAYVDAYGADYFNMENWDALAAAADETGYAVLTDDTMALLASVISTDAWGETEADVPNYLAYEAVYGAYDWKDVGFFKTGDYEIVMIVENPIENPNYYVPYNLGGTALVYKDLWESCKSYYDKDNNKVEANDPNVASCTTNYGTSVETTKSYGPYKLTYFELDKQITFERNEKWYGYHDGKHLGQYQTDIISCTIIADHNTALLAFLNGEIDSVSLMQEDMPTYGTSDYIRYNPQSYTTKLSFNTNFDSLYSHGTGSQILVNKNFRNAFSLALNASEFASSFTTGSAGYGLLNYLYVYDPFTGATYRDTDGAKGALVDLYGMTYGPDGDYENLDEAYEAITGYDLDAAKALMAKAYDECVAEGLYDGGNVELQINVYNTEDIYVQMVNYFQTCLDAATAGTGFEGKIKMKLVVDADYYETMYSGNTDIIFTTWGGAAYSPYTMLYQCYCDAADGSGQQMEYGFDTTQIPVTININGMDYTTDLQTWSKWACGYGEDDGVVISSDDKTATLAAFGTYDAQSRADAFAKLEYAYLSYFTTIPLYYRASAVLVSQQGDYAVQNYLDLIGFGGIQFYTYNYTDAEWANVAGTLTY